MKKRLGTWLIVSTVMLSGFATISQAGVVLVDSDGNKTYVSDGKMKNVSEEDTQTIIFDVNRELLTIVDNEEQTYAQGTIDEFCGEVSSAMDSAMKGMSEEEKAMMQQFMGKMGKGKPASPPSVTVSKEGSGGKVAGLNSTKYSVKVDGRLYEEIWISDDSIIMDEFKKMRKMVDMSEKMAKCAGGPMSHGYASTPESTPEYKELLMKGFPVKVISHETGTPEVDENLVEAKKQSIPDSEFQAPKEYKKQTFKELMGRDQ